MGRVKEFAIWLSACVFQWQMSDEEIIARFRQREDAKRIDEVEPWLKDQLKTVRENPEQFRELMGWKRGRDF